MEKKKNHIWGCCAFISQTTMSVYTLSFGKYIGKCLCDVAVDDPAYVVWLAGVITKYALKEETMAAWKAIQAQNPEAITEAKAFVKDKCLSCLQHSYNPKQPCSKSRQLRNYHYHPYG